MESYTTIKHFADFQYEDRRSIFIGSAMPVSSEADAVAFISEIKKKYSDANHNVYAYMLRNNSIMRFSDDREPQGTAGMPVLDCIRKSGCTDVVIVVTRYFGGTLLGSGGLVRAYGSAAAGALKAAEIATYDIFAEYRLGLTYSDYQKILPLFKSAEFRISNTEFSAGVEVRGSIRAEHAEKFEKELTELTNGRAAAIKLGEKYEF